MIWSAHKHCYRRIKRKQKRRKIRANRIRSPIRRTKQTTAKEFKRITNHFAFFVQRSPINHEDRQNTKWIHLGRAAMEANQSGIGVTRCSACNTEEERSEARARLRYWYQEDNWTERRAQGPSIWPSNIWVCRFNKTQSN